MKTMNVSLPATATPRVTTTGAHAADLQVTVSGARENGTVYFALFDRASFLAKPITTAQAPAAQPFVSFRGLAPGSYAVSAFQDLNGNGELDRNLIGVPLEPYGFSNDATGNMAPPSFDAAAVQVGAENQSITITLR